MENNGDLDKEYIKLEEADDLKELGFKERCFFAFDNCSTPMRCSDLRTSNHKFYGVNYNNSTYTSQPSYSQVFRWFREKFGLYGYVFKYSKHFNWKIDDEIGTIEFNQNDNIKTYEEAEFVCLRRLIETLKLKTNDQGRSETNV